MIMKKTGFTLIELMVTLAVLGTLLAIAVPQFKSTTSNSRLTAGINSLSGDFAFARTEAVKRATSVSVTAINVADWAAGGWQTTLTTSGTVLRTSPALTGNTTITTIPGGTASVQFNSNGRSNSAGNISFKLCDDRAGNNGKLITVNSTGQTFLQTQQVCP